MNFGRLKPKLEVGSSVSASCETLGNATPVKEVPYYRFDVVSSAVLPVEIVGVFPDIDNRKRCDTCAGDRRFGVWCAYDGQFSVFRDKPCPTAAKTLRRRILISDEPLEREVDGILILPWRKFIDQLWSGELF